MLRLLMQAEAKAAEKLAKTQAAAAAKSDKEAARQEKQLKQTARRGLQPYVAEAATLCDGGCNPVWWRLQPYVAEAATACDRGCNRM